MKDSGSNYGNVEMMTDTNNIEALDKRFQKCAIYFENSDCVEYVRYDCANIYRRIDGFLTIILSMDSRLPIGFKLKGFQNFFLRHIKNDARYKNQDFLLLVNVIEEAITEIGDSLFDQNERNEAYTIASEIAQEDQVKLTDFPKAA